MALYNDETAGKSLQKVFNRIGIRRSLNLGDLSSTNTSLSNLLNGLVKGDGNFIAEDLNAIKSIFSNGLTNTGYRNVIGSAAIFTNIDGKTNFFDPKITYQNRLDITEVFTGNPRFLGGNGLTANYFQNDQILFDEHANFEYNVDPNQPEAEVFGGVTEDGQIPPDNFWEEGDFEYSAKVHPQSAKINTGVKWEGYFVPRRTGPVRFRIRCTGYFTFDFNQEGYEEDDNNDETLDSKNRPNIGVGKTYTEHMRIGISTEIDNFAGLPNQNTIFLSPQLGGDLEKMNTIGIGMTAVHPNIQTGSKVFDFDKNTGTIELTPPEGFTSAVTGLLDGTETVGFTRHLGDEIEHSIDTHVLVEYKKNRIRMSYFHHKNFDSKDIDRIFNIDIKEMDIATHQDFRYNRLFSLDYDFSEEAKGDFSRYYDGSIRSGGTGSLDSPTIGSTNNSEEYVKLTTTSKIVVEYEPPRNLDSVGIKTFQVTNTQGNYAPSNRETGSKGVIVTAESPILTLRTKEKTQGVEIGNLIVSTQNVGDDSGEAGDGSQGGDGEPSIPFFARVKDFVINNYIVMDMNALPATGNNAGIGVTNAAQVKIINHRGLVRRVRVNPVTNSDTITSSVATNPFTGTQNDNPNSRTAYKDVQKGMIVVGEGDIPDYTVVDEVISKTELKLSAPVTVSANQDVFFYDSKGLRDNSTLAYCDRFNTSGPDVRCLIAKVKDGDGNPIAGGHQPGTTSFEVEDDNGVESGWTLQGIYFGDDGTAVTNVVVGTSSTTITIGAGITAPLLDGTRFTAVNITGSPDRTLCCPPTDTSPPFRATAEGLNTVKNKYENLKIDGGNLVFESLILQDNTDENDAANNTESINGNTVEANLKIKITSTTENNKSYRILGFDPSAPS